MPEIVNLSRPTASEVNELRDIFFESSIRKEFKDQLEKEAFFRKYLGFYLECFPELVWVARQGRILGYMVGSPVTRNHEIFTLQPHLQSFDSYFDAYPAHLHVNLHADARGMGLGSKLFSELEKQIQGMKIRGIHIMTGPDSRNKSFYRRLGFTFEVTQSYECNEISLLGKSL